MKPTWLILAALTACSVSSQERTDRTDAPSDTTPLEELAPEPTVPAEAARATLPVFGGTLHIAEDGHTAIVGDVQGDRLILVDTDSGARTATIDLPAGATPFRITDADGTAWVSLRGSGQVGVVDLTTGALVDTWDGCLEPRGLDTDDSSVFLACASGELVTFDRATGARRSVRVEKDLRDVIVQDGALWVSRLRSAEVLRVGFDGAILDRQAPPRVRHTRPQSHVSVPSHTGADVSCIVLFLLLRALEYVCMFVECMYV